MVESYDTGAAHIIARVSLPHPPPPTSPPLTTHNRGLTPALSVKLTRQIPSDTQSLYGPFFSVNGWPLQSQDQSLSPCAVAVCCGELPENIGQTQQREAVWDYRAVGRRGCLSHDPHLPSGSSCWLVTRRRGHGSHAVAVYQNVCHSLADAEKMWVIPARPMVIVRIRVPLAAHLNGPIMVTQ